MRLFIASTSDDKESIEKKAADFMAQDTGDIGWNDDTQYKSLILEHHMAASRFGFADLYMPLNSSGNLILLCVMDLLRNCRFYQSLCLR